MICVHCNTPLPDTAKYCTECGGDPSNPGTDARPPQKTAGVSSLHDMLRGALGDRYELGDLLGRGGMGAVFKALDKTLDRDVAIKVLPPEFAHDENFVGRFEREAKTAAKLDHPGIIPIYAVEHTEHLYYFVMKHVTGRSLDEILRAGPMPIDACQRILWESACALGHAHQRGVVHRDIKPANIMVDDAGRAVVMDFGISKASQAATQFTATGQVIGTPHYMSPEQAKGLQVDGRSDLYALGVVGYRMLSGRLPFADDSVHTIIYKHIFEEPEPVEALRRDTPPFLAAAVRQALAKDPNDRYATMEEFASAVLPEQPVAGPSGVVAIAGLSSSTDAATQITPPTIPPRASRRSAASAPKKRRSPVLAMIGVAVVLGGGGYGAWRVWNGQQARGGTASQPGSVSGIDSSTPSAVAGAAPARPDSPLVSQDSVLRGAVTIDQPRNQPAESPRTPPESRPETRQPAVQPPPPRVGFLTINAVPFGKVFLDGVEIGDTPIVGREVAPGSHAVEIRREGYQTMRDTVVIEAGNTFRKNYSLIPESMR